jgi:hypothetical protein
VPFIFRKKGVGQHHRNGGSTCFGMVGQHVPESTDKEKYTFLADLKRSFDKIRNLTQNDFNITIEDRKCNACSLGKTVKHFEVFNNKTNSYIGSFGFLIDVENGMLKNIYRCLGYKETKEVFVKPEGLPGIFIKRHIEPDLLK